MNLQEKREVFRRKVINEGISATIAPCCADRLLHVDVLLSGPPDSTRLAEATIDLMNYLDNHKEPTIKLLERISPRMAKLTMPALKKFAHNGDRMSRMHLWHHLTGEGITLNNNPDKYKWEEVI